MRDSCCKHFVVLVRLDGEVVATRNKLALWHITQCHFDIGLPSAGLANKILHAFECPVGITDEPAYVIESEQDEKIVWLVCGYHFPDEVAVLS